MSQRMDPTNSLQGIKKKRKKKTRGLMLGVELTHFQHTSQRSDPTATRNCRSTSAPHPPSHLPCTSRSYPPHNPPVPYTQAPSATPTVSPPLPPATAAPAATDPDSQSSDTRYTQYPKPAPNTKSTTRRPGKHSRSPSADMALPQPSG